MSNLARAGRLTSTYIIVAAAVVTMLFPYLWVFVSSFKPALETYAVPPTLLPMAPTLDNYRAAFGLVREDAAGDPSRHVAEGLGLGYLPPIELPPSTRLANVLLADIDVRGVRGRQGINLLLASALTEWRIRLRQITRSPAWKTFVAAHAAPRSVPTTVQPRVPRGLALSIYGFNGLLPIGQVIGRKRGTPVVRA